jgi:hypothetical protein
MAETDTSRLPNWAEQMKALERVGGDLLGRWRPEGPSQAEAQDMYKLTLSILACGYLCHVYTDGRRPVFMPLWNYAFNQGGPNPDFVYSNTEVDPDGVYQISGYRGSVRFVEITQQETNRLKPAAITRKDPPLTLTYDLDDLNIDQDGYFSVVLSGERPDGHDGDWWFLDPRARALLMRKCSCDWNREVDARVAINRLDQAGADMSPEETARRFSELPAWIEDMIDFDMSLVCYYREHHGINVLLRSGWIADHGGLPRQAYYDGIHQIDDTEALIVEMELPRQCRYWQLLVADDRFATVDWVNRQSSLNDVQARIDTDGKFRAVISRFDPGVPNWLDKADFPWGIVQMRINLASDYPDPTVKKVPLAEVRRHLPADTPVVSPAERQEQLRIRRQGAQLRRIW